MANKQSGKSLTQVLNVEVFGADLDGLQFIERTRALTITRDGATIPLANKLGPESELIVRNPVTNQEAVARVVDVVRDPISVHVYGIAFVDPSVNLWQTEFAGVQSQKTIRMECGRCHNVGAVLLTEIEMKIFEMKQALTRRCEYCDSTTTWKQTDRKVTEQSPTEPKVSAGLRNIPPIEEPATGSGQGRRKEKRTPMKVAACVRGSGGEEVVECEDVSRGGFRFKSREKYQVGTQIEAAVPYAKNSVNIFVPARIAYQQGLSGGFYRHGAAYIKSSK
jgi:bacterioferritin-associated ferredoxin